MYDRRTIEACVEIVERPLGMVSGSGARQIVSGLRALPTRSWSKEPPKEEGWYIVSEMIDGKRVLSSCHVVQSVSWGILKVKHERDTALLFFSEFDDARWLRLDGPDGLLAGVE